MKNILRAIILIAVITATKSQSAYSQENEYIKAYHDYIILKSLVNNRSLNLDVAPRKPIGSENSSILYRPKAQNTLGFNVSFKHFGLSTRFRLTDHPSTGRGDRQKPTDYFDIQLHSYGKKFGYDLYYQKNRGYFISDGDDIFNSTPIGGKVPRRNDLRLRNFTANLFYNFNPDKFSYRAAFLHDEKQLKSAGAFILTGSVGYFRASADSSFIPPNPKFGFNPESFFREVDFYTLSITPGYAHTFVLPANFYATTSISGLVGLQYYEANAKRVYDDGFDHYLKGILRTSIGYNGDRWAFGAIMSADVQNLNTDFVRYRTINLDTSVFLTYRIQTNLLKEYDSFFDFIRGKKRK